MWVQRGGGGSGLKGVEEAIERTRTEQRRRKAYFHSLHSTLPGHDSVVPGGGKIQRVNNMTLFLAIPTS